MSRRNHTYFNVELINGNSYLKNCIKGVKNEPKGFKCTFCKKKSLNPSNNANATKTNAKTNSKLNQKTFLYFENLYGHLDSLKHRGNSKLTLKELEEALIYLKTSKSQGSPPNTDTKTSESVSDTKSPSCKQTDPMELETFYDQEICEEVLFRFRVARFILINDLPFSFADKFSKFLKNLYTLYPQETLENFTVNRKHITHIASNCISPYVKDKYFSLLESTPFSISLDCGTAKGNVEYLAVNARYLDSSSSTKSTTKLLGIVEMKDSATGKTLNNLVHELLFKGEEEERRKENIMGVSSDGAANMLAKNKGFASRLKQTVKHLLIIHDFCHIWNLILKACLKKFPQNYVNIVNRISSTFSQSPQKAA